MRQITARLPDLLLQALDSTAAQQKWSRVEVIREAIRNHLEDFEDIAISLERLRDPDDPILDWEKAKRDLLA